MLTSRQLLLQAESLGKNSRGSSVASPIVIDPKIAVFQHNRVDLTRSPSRRRTAGTCAKGTAGVDVLR
jgi:hypothetical protein